MKNSIIVIILGQGSLSFAQLTFDLFATWFGAARKAVPCDGFQLAGSEAVGTFGHSVTQSVPMAFFATEMGISTPCAPSDLFPIGTV